MKSGTTTLHELLAQHPEIAMCDPKEPCYFVPPEILARIWPEMWELGIWRSEDAYASIFPDKPGARYRGESSTDYSKLPSVPGVAEKIKAYNPDARFIYVVRDPVERTISHYWHMAEHRGETRAPLDAITHDPHYTDVSHYAMQLAPYLQHFGPDRIKIVTFEALKSNPGAVMRGLCAWLGVSPEFSVQDPDAAHNVTPQIVRQHRAGSGLLHRIRHSAAWDRIGPQVPAAIRQLGTRLAERRVGRKSVDMGEVISYLRPIQRDQTETLAGIAGRSFPEWKTLYGE
jgi:hypothetical protein